MRRYSYFAVAVVGMMVFLTEAMSCRSVYAQEIQEVGEPAPVAATVPAPPPLPPPTKATLDIIEFQNTPVTAVLEYYARLTGRSIISAPNLTATITFRSQTRLTLEEALQALDSVLAMNGITVVPMGEKFLKVVPSTTAKPEGVPILLPEGRSLPPGDTLVTQIIALKSVEAQEVVGALQPYMHAYGQLLAFAKSNSVLITDTGANIAQMMEIVKYVDQPSALRMQTKVYILKNAKSTEVVQRLQAIVSETQQIGARAVAPGVPAPVPVPSPIPRPVSAVKSGAVGTAGEESVVEGKVIITADERTNKIFLLSRPTNFAFFDQMIAELDAKVDPDVVTKVVPLDYADAQELAGMVNSLVSGGGYTPSRRTTTPSSGSSRTGGAGYVPPPPPVSTPGGGGGLAETGFLEYAAGVRILPDPRTNSLLIMATKTDMERILALVRSLDSAIAQVLVEVVIGEVNLDRNLEVGINVLRRLTKNGQVVHTGGFSTMTDSGGSPAPTPVNLGAASSELASTAFSSVLTYYATFENLKLDVAVRALAATSSFRVLSTPIIQTLHNQEGSIVVGESRPVLTSTLSDVVSSTSTSQVATSLRANVEFKDIAIELKVTPRINPDGYVTMDIDQKINDVGATVNIGGSDVPVITKREAKSQVLVKDQSTIVLGGLIKEQKGVTETKVPFLGDIPLLGHLFKDKSNTKTRTELIVFIRPTVLRSDAQAVSEARHRRESLGSEELQLDFEKQERNHKTGAITNAPSPTAK